MLYTKCVFKCLTEHLSMLWSSQDLAAGVLLQIFVNIFDIQGGKCRSPKYKAQVML